MGAHSSGLLRGHWSSGVSDPSCCHGGMRAIPVAPPPPRVGHVSLGSASDWGACLERVGAHRCAQLSCGQRRLSACANDPAANQADQFCVCVFFCFGALSYTLLRRRCVCARARVCVIHRPVSSHWHSACDPSQSLTRQKNFCAHPL